MPSHAISRHCHAIATPSTWHGHASNRRRRQLGAAFSSFRHAIPLEELRHVAGMLQACCRHTIGGAEVEKRVARHGAASHDVVMRLLYHPCWLHTHTHTCCYGPAVSPLLPEARLASQDTCAISSPPNAVFYFYLIQFYRNLCEISQVPKSETEVLGRL